MATNKRDLRAYVRYDGTGRIIPGSLVLRRSKPKVGDWKEIQTYECCDGGGCCEPGVVSYSTSTIAEQFPLPISTGVYINFEITNIFCPGLGEGGGGTLNIPVFVYGEAFTVEDLLNLINNSEVAKNNGINVTIVSGTGDLPFEINVDKCTCLGKYLSSSIVSSSTINPIAG